MTKVLFICGKKIMTKKIRRQLIKLQNIASKGGGRIPALHEIYYKWKERNEQDRRENKTL